ncbi:MAG: hypothetical protein L0K34_02225, partial [Ancrocorticia sp.]|nr:hypothetical protein [Ancrocorticia sp.]
LSPESTRYGAPSLQTTLKALERKNQMDTAIRTDTGEVMSFGQWIALPAGRRPVVMCDGTDPRGKPCHQPASVCAEDSDMVRPYWRANHIQNCDHASKKTDPSKPARVAGTRIQNRHDGPALIQITAPATDIGIDDRRASTHVSATGPTTRRASYSTGGGKKKPATSEIKLKTLLYRLINKAISPDTLIQLPGYSRGPVRDLVIAAKRLDDAPRRKVRFYCGRVGNVNPSQSGNYFLNFTRDRGSIMISESERSNRAFPAQLDRLEGHYVLALGIAHDSAGMNSTYVTLTDPVYFVHRPA